MAYVLILRLEGILQSWGERARWDVRDTASVPTKSGVIGILSCAMGIPRYDERIIQLDRFLRMGVRVDSPGVWMEDFHTVSGKIKNAEGKERRAKSQEL